MFEKLKDYYYRVEQTLQLDKFTTVIFLFALILTLCFSLWVRQQTHKEAAPYINLNVSTPLSLDNREYLVQCVFLCGESLYTLELEPEPQCICELPNGMTCTPTLPLQLMESLE
jgi:hypothetical protein